jgi:TonB family protein
MSSEPSMNPFDLLGQTPPTVGSVSLQGSNLPKLDIGWGEFHQGLGSCIAALFTTPGASKNFLAAGFFKDSWIERPAPRRALVAAALWHIALLALPLPQFSAPRRNPAFDNTVISWTGPAVDLPPVEIRAEKSKPSPRGEPDKPLPYKGADAFHPRQRIFTDPVRPNHPRQTLINPAAPAIPPKFLPNLPNVVQLAQMPGPARPRLEISANMLRMLHPRARRSATTTSAPAPNLSNTEQRPADLSIAMTPNEPARPKLEINASAAPLLSSHKPAADAGPAPQLVPPISAASNGANSTFIALSAAPAPPAPVVERPQGNLAARVSISPEGKQRGVPSGSPHGETFAHGASGGDRSSSGGIAGGNGAAKGSMDVSISGGNPRDARAISGLGTTRPRLSLPSSQPVFTRQDADPVNEIPVRTSPPNFAALPPGAKPELIFGPKRVYSMNINMPNLSSAMGSWILRFSELGTGTAAPHITSGGDLVGPEPLRKVDPKYPPTLMAEHVEGEVILYAVIRRDGSVDSIQLVHGIDEQLDANAMEALSQWKFRPAEKNGQPVDLEAIVHIPFRAPSPQ